MSQRGYTIILPLILLSVWLPHAAFAQTPPKPSPRRTRKPPRQARTRNNRAGRDPKKQKELCPEDLKGTCPGTFSLVYTAVANTRPAQGDNPTDARSLTLAFNVYVTPRIFLELDQTHVLSQRAVAQPRANGVGDSIAIAGIDALLESKRTPGVAVLYGVKVPTANAAQGLGTGKVDQQFAVNIHKQFGRKYFEYDAGLIFARVPNNEGTRVATLGGVVLSGVTQYALNKHHLLHLQLDATLPAHGYKGDLAALSFWQPRLNDHVSVRLGATTGITSNVPRAGFYAALVWEDNVRRWW